MRDGTVGIGVIGTGFARKVQIPAFLTCEGAVIASIASGSLENARSAAADAGAGHFTADWRETVAHPGVDLVCITTPPSMHRDMTLFAIENGKHILCEKPMAMDLAEAEEMAAAATGSGRLALIDHELRFQPGRQVAYRMLREGAIGRVRHVKYGFRAPHRGDPGLPWNWWSDAGAGGGALGAIVSHIIDSFNWLLGVDASEVFCQLHTTVKERVDAKGRTRSVTSDDESLMILKFNESELLDDATGLVSVSMTHGPGYENRLELHGEKGSMRIDHRGEVSTAAAADSDWTRNDVPIAPPVPGVADTGFSSGFMAFAPKIVEAVRSGTNTIEHGATFADGVRVQKVLDAARLSDVEGRAVSIK